MNTSQQMQGKIFTGYQVFMIVILAILQFTVVLDFMVLSPLGAILMDKLKMDTSQFGMVVSAYAFSAGGAGILAAGFADMFDRKKMLLFFYAGFIVGTILCAMANSYESLLIARIVTGLFGGVISSICFAIISDLYIMETRGRVMGFVQMAFAGSQILGIPIGLLLANKFGWNYSFWMIAAFGIILGAVIILYMKPINDHLKIKSDRNAFQHLAKTVSNKKYLMAFCATTLLATGGFMVMPFASAYTTGNLGRSMEDLPVLYGATGIFSMISGPLIGKFSDKIGKFQIFFAGSIVCMIMMGIYSHLGITPLWVLIVINILLFVGIQSRIISSSALMSSIPDMQDRGAFMSINSAVQQTSGGIGALLGGLIVVKTSSGLILHYDILAYCVMFAMTVTIIMMYFVNKIREEKEQQIASVKKSKPEAVTV